MTAVNRLLRTARRVGLPVGRWPEEGSRVLHHRRLIDVHRIDLVLDVGAHHGEFATSMRTDVGYRGDIVSFEPAAAALEVVRARAAADSRWEVRGVALGDRTGSADLFHYALDSSMSSLRRPTRLGLDDWQLQDASAETVTTARLDELPLRLDERQGVFLKVDTQGHDLAVLAGAECVLRHIAVLQMEVSVRALYEGTPLLVETLAEVTRMGFALSGFFQVAQDAKLRAVELDLVAVRA
jgi:FkbM family methyltransferase